jgi:hypothetical protein
MNIRWTKQNLDYQKSNLVLNSVNTRLPMGRRQYRTSLGSSLLAGHFQRRCIRSDRRQTSNATPIQHVTGNLAQGNAPGLSPITQPIGGDNLEERKGKEGDKASRRFCKVDFRMTTLLEGSVRWTSG